MLKIKNLSIAKLIQILNWDDIVPINIMKQNLSVVRNANQEMDSEDLVAIIHLMITNRVCHSRYYSM